ncbi:MULTISPECIES: TVP38/TMEM64 family protein [Haloferax]|uniref:TVP38/TMEM64 family protein n=2 Tax=Haloferax TaxID=2251 RepID=A0A6G1Z5A5_9EURY|nr:MULTISPECIES: TVP38/TMEM64 family protein [Haloferax]KAB1189004.1 TVP38/TMEM64 family protein [Haloferax sp. CBA1149]MRW81730.1 TVP38/TMEM64 family protein [Haloferax marinisediminis]
MTRVPTLFESTRDRWQATFLLVALVAAMVVVGSVVVNQYPFLADPQELRTVLLQVGPLAPLAFIAVQILQVLVAPVPGQALGFASGFLFGALWGTVYSMVGIVIGTTLAVVLARHFGRPYVERVVTADALALFDDTVATHGLAVLFLIFLVPGLPDDAICFAAGLTDIPVRRIVAVAAVGRLPGFLLVNLAGSAAANSEPILLVIFVSALVSASVLGFLYRRQILAVFTE